MSKANKTDKIDNNLLANSELGEPTDTSFITNIKIDVSDSSDRISEKKLSSSENIASSPENAFIGNNLAVSRHSSRTTTLALDPRPYKKRERVYTTIIIILSIALVAQSVLFWAMYLRSSTRQSGNQTNKKQEQIIISGAKLNQDRLANIADIVMRKHMGVSLVILPKNERVALAEFAQGIVQIIQTTEPLSIEEKKHLDLMIGKPVQEIHIQQAALGIYTSEFSPVNELTLGQLRKIYLGEISSGKPLAVEDFPIATYKLEDNQFIDKIFQEKVIKTPHINIDFNRPLLSTGTLIAIGYGEIKSVLPNKIKLIKLKIGENEESVAPLIGEKVNEKYPLVYNTYWYATDLPGGVLQSLMEEIKKQR